jgi:hypothetical protein
MGSGKCKRRSIGLTGDQSNINAETSLLSAVQYLKSSVLAAELASAAEEIASLIATSYEAALAAVDSTMTGSFLFPLQKHVFTE